MATNKKGSSTTTVEDGFPQPSVKVVVLKGKHVRHDGEEFKQNTSFLLPAPDAKRLINLGFAKAVETLLQEMAEGEDQDVTMIKMEGQTSITTTDPAPPLPGPEAA